MGNSYTDSIFLEPITIVEVEQELKKLNPNKSSGFDDINPRVIRETSSLISCSLPHIFNQSITTGIIPSQFKIPVKSPIYKSNENDIFQNYRPIAVFTLLFQNLRAFNVYV